MKCRSFPGPRNHEWFGKQHPRDTNNRAEKQELLNARLACVHVRGFTVFFERSLLVKDHVDERDKNRWGTPCSVCD